MSADIQEFDFSVDLLKAILWQYNDAVNLQGLLNQKAAWYEVNQTEFWNDWYVNVFDLATANDFGLSVWSIILGLPLFVNTPPDIDKPTFGFGPFANNFNRGNFSSTTGQTVILTTETKRRALQLRYAQLTSSGTVPEINRLLKYVFSDLGEAYLLDRLDMTQRYVFLFPLTSDLKYLFDNYDILPRPAGVASSYFEGDVEYFGFGPFGANFTHGNFGA